MSIVTGFLKLLSLVLYRILTGSLISNVAITQAEAEFFGNLTVFQFDEAGLFQNCPQSQQKNVQKLRFCLSDVQVDTRKLDTTVAKNSNSTSNNSTSSIVDSSHNSKEDTGGGLSPSTVTSIIVVVICVTPVLLIGIVVVYRIKTASLRDDDNESELEQSMSAAETYPSTGETTITNPRNSNRHNNSSQAHGVALASVWEDVDLRAVQVDVDATFDIRKLSEDSNVWLVRYQGVRLLVSKRLKKIANTNTPSEKQAHREHTRALISEIKLASQLKNAKIVQFVGAAWTIEADLQALYEFMDGGDLRTYLDDERTPRAWSLQKIQIAIDMAEALVYCHHSFSPPVVHSYLNSRNVLLSMDGDTKLKNVGVSRYNSSQRAVGSARWLAPEIITGANSSDYGPAADIFALGVVLCELDTHKVPYEVDVKAQNLTEVALLQLVAPGELKPRLSKSCPQEVADLALRCLDLNLEERPTAAELTYELRVFKKSLAG